VGQIADALIINTLNNVLTNI